MVCKRAKLLHFYFSFTDGLVDLRRDQTQFDTFIDLSSLLKLLIMSLNNKTAFITGASRGIGKAIAFETC